MQKITIKSGLFFFALLIVLNILILDFQIFIKNGKENKRETISTDNRVSSITTKTESVKDVCPNSCLVQISEATRSVKLSQTSVTASEPVSNSSVKEYFIALGGGSNVTDDWTDVPGIQAYVDSVKYGSIKKVIFEASVHIPTGNEKAYVRLYNVTDKHPVWNSEVSLEGGDPKLLFSDPITLDVGNKLYQVQMKTQLKFTAVLDQARIHITTY